MWRLDKLNPRGRTRTSSTPVAAQVRAINLGPQDNNLLGGNLFGGVRGLPAIDANGGFESSDYDSPRAKRRIPSSASPSAADSGIPPSAS